MPKVTVPEVKGACESRPSVGAGVGTGVGTGFRMAVCLTDLDRLDPAQRQRMLKGKLDLTKIVQVTLPDRRQPVPCVAFTCDLLTAALVCDLLRDGDSRCDDVPTRVYVLKRESWSRVPLDTRLTVAECGKVVLNRSFFAAEVIEAFNGPLSQLPPPVRESMFRFHGNQ